MSHVLYFSKIKMISHRPCLEQGAYRHHQFVWDCFENTADQPRDFLYRIDLDRGFPGIYLVSRRIPKTLDPTSWSVQVKPYDPQIRKGDRLLFSMRANPVVYRKEHESDSRGKRHDLVRAWKHQFPNEQKPLKQIIEETGAEWLSRQGERCGFKWNPAGLRVDAYERHQFRKKGGPPITFSTMDFNGCLEVIEPTSFLNMLSAGLGHSKGFGCGLMLVRRV